MLFPTFELLVDAVAQILTKLLQFRSLTYFLTSWPTYLTFDLETQQTSVISQDMSKRLWFISEDMLISFKHEYRRLILLSCCDVTGDIISMKILFLESFAYDRSISDVNGNFLKSWNFQKWRNLRSWRTFSSGVSTEIGYAILIAKCITYILSFWSTL